MSIEDATTLLGWCTVINFGLLIVSTIAIVGARKMMTRFHARMFDLDEPVLAAAYFQYLAQYKIATLVLNLVPYLALKLMAV
jgi:hypothetical protein